MASPDYLTPQALNHFIEEALREDVRTGDVSSMASLPPQAEAKARLIVKDEGVMAGMKMAQTIFRHVDPSLQFEAYVNDGEQIHKGDIAFEVFGNARSILTSERLVLNCMQRMSGIATKTYQMNALIRSYKAKLLDTRKTTPNFRMCEKWAVLIGGGVNHRFGLFDVIMLKDNHIDFAGGIAQAIHAAKSYLQETKQNLKVEVETRNLREVREVLDIGGVDTIMLDNMSLDDMKTAVELIDGACNVEASGGITEKTIVGVAACGVDFISVGALTYSFRSLDMSLKATKA